MFLRIRIFEKGDRENYAEQGLFSLCHQAEGLALFYRNYLVRKQEALSFEHILNSVYKYFHRRLKRGCGEQRLCDALINAMQCDKVSAIAPASFIILLRILIKQNTALHSTVRVSVSQQG